LTLTEGRHRYRGLYQVLSFNWPYYLAALAMISAGTAVLCLVSLPFWLAVTISGMTGLALFFSAMSLFVAHLVYDLSSAFTGEWLVRGLPALPKSWVNIHSGLDEATSMLEALFPGRGRAVLDLYDPRETSEPSITRAREACRSPYPAQRARPEALPVPEGCCDLAVLAFAAHEVRDPAKREALFKELFRIVRPGGSVVLAEHCRDAATAAAFGPNVLHFFPKREWLRVAQVAGFELARTAPLTPFATALFWRKP